MEVIEEEPQPIGLNPAVSLSGARFKQGLQPGKILRYVVGGLRRTVLVVIGVGSGIAFAVAGWPMRDGNPQAMVGLLTAAVMTGIVITITDIRYLKLMLMVSALYIGVGVVCAWIGSLPMIAAAVVIVCSATLIRAANL